MTEADRPATTDSAAEAPVPAAAEQAAPAAETPVSGAESGTGEPQAPKKPKAAPRRKATSPKEAKEDGPKPAKKAASKSSAKKKASAAKEEQDAPAAPAQDPAPAAPAELQAQEQPAAPKPKRSHKARPKPQAEAAPEPAQDEPPAADKPVAAQSPAPSEPAPVEPVALAPVEPAAPAPEPEPAAQAPQADAQQADYQRRARVRTLPRPVDEMTVDELIEYFPPARRGRPSKREKQLRLAREALIAAKDNPTPELLVAARNAVVTAMGDQGAPAPAPERPAASQDAPRDEQGEPQADSQADPDSGESAAEGGYGQRRRHHERRSDDRRGERDTKPERPWQKGQQQGERDAKRERDPKRDAQQGGQPNQQRQRDGKQGQQGFSAQDRQFGKNGRKNRREFVTEPKVSREELEELKVSDLRAKAVELGIDPAGLKKSELVDAVYAGLFKQEGFFEFQGVLEIANEGHGHVRTKGYLPSEHDVYVSVSAVRGNALRRGDHLTGIAHMGRPGDKFPGVTKILSVNGKDPEAARNRPRFGDLTPVFPSEPLKMEHGKDSILGRCIDLVSPVGKGQRGLIVSPPKAGKTTVLKKIAESIAANNPEVHLICLLVDERPEEVTDMQRSICGEVVASTFDMPCDNHIAVSELVIERAKRLVEQGEDVVILLDSITRLARAYNLAQPASGRILSGGVDSTALYPPKRFLGAARNIENGGSLTILASALVDTGSKMDEVIFEEFKGTGNMELKLDRDLADRRVFPAIDPVASGTRKEELLLDPSMAPFIWGVRRILANMNNNERAMTMLIKSLKATQNNEEFLVRSARKAQQQEMNLDL